MTEQTDYQEMVFAYEREKRARKQSEMILQTQTRRMYQINTQLNSTIVELQKHQRSAIQQEKLAALGRLTAGVAHEVNNPLAFAIGNLQVLEKYVEFFSEIIEQAIQEKITPISISNLLSTHFPTTTLDYLKDDSHYLIEESLTGLLRVKEIVSNLRTFSRNDDNSRIATDVNHATRAAIIMIEAKINEQHTLNVDLTTVPVTYINPNHLTQVILNLLSNALDALIGKSDGEIWVKTYATDKDICILVSDNGCGISDENKKNLFLPFFTTKPFGQGAGLGLSICYDKVTVMNGTIECISELHNGTQFLVKLPIEPRQQKRDPKSLGTPTP
jgi:two-component system, NtrC family, sensor kinase